MQFTDFNFSEEVLEGIRNVGFTECMPVQEEVYRHAMEEGRDVTVQSQTGSGKTAAFLLWIFEKFTREPQAGHRAIVVAPTRELAVQIEQEAQALGGHLPLRLGCFHGGVSYGPQEKKLREGVDLVIGTPGRLIDFANSKKLIMKDFDTVVIDEADRLFDMGFYPDIRRMLKMMKGPKERQTMLFSATISQRVGHLSWEFMNEPEPIVINPEQITVDEITQEVYHVSSAEKVNLLLGLLRREKPENALIFTNTKDMAVRLANRLSINGFNVEYIMGDLPQRKRLSIIKRIKKGELELLVATDVAARGLHINDLDMVINYDIPEDPESYVHRIGRTARAGKSGKAITLACEKYVYGLEAIEKFIDMKIPVQWADEELYQSEDKSAGMRVEGNRDRGGGRSRDQRSRDGRSRDRRSGSRDSGSRGAGGRGGGKSKQSTSGGGASSGGRGGQDRKDGKEGRREKEQAGRSRSSSGPEGTQSSPKQKASRSRSSGARQKQSSPGKPQSRGDAQPASKSPSKNSDLESRLAYYRQKYGEDFQLTDSSSGNGGKPSGGGTTSSASGNSPSANEDSAAEKKEKGKKGILGRLLGK